MKIGIMGSGSLGCYLGGRYDTAAAEQMIPMVAADTVVLPVQNGIEHLETT